MLPVTSASRAASALAQKFWRYLCIMPNQWSTMPCFSGSGLSGLGFYLTWDGDDTEAGLLPPLWLPLSQEPKPECVVRNNELFQLLGWLWTREFGLWTLWSHILGWGMLDLLGATVNTELVSHWEGPVEVAYCLDWHCTGAGDSRALDTLCFKWVCFGVLGEWFFRKAPVLRLLLSSK